MTDTTFIDGDLSQSNRIVADWLNDVNNLRYGNNDAARGAALLQSKASGTGAVTRTAQAKLNDIASNSDYSSTANFNAATAALNATIGMKGYEVGDGNMFGYPDNEIAQIYRTVTAPASIQHTFRVVTASKGDNTTYIGTTNAYFEARDIAGITAGERGVLYALHCSVVPSFARNNVPYDDVAAITFSNTTGSIGANGTDAIYGSANSFAFGDRLTGTAEWYSIFTADCNATVGFVLGGRISTFAIDLNGANIDTGSAIRLANVNYIVARNAGNTANYNLIGLDVNNAVQLGGPNVSGVRVMNTWFGATVPSVQAGATYTIANTDNDVIFNGSGCTVTLPAAASFPGRVITLKTTVAFTAISASSNVVPLIGGAAGTAILAATAGKWAKLVSDGANWQIMAGN